MTDGACKQGTRWNEFARDWADYLEPSHVQLFDAMLDASELGPGSSVLDAGCGAGGLCVRARARDIVPSGIDASDALVEIARFRNPGCDVRVGDLRELPWPDDTFDAVIACQSFFFCDDPVATLAELRRVVRPGGQVVVSTWGRAEQNELRFVFAAVGKLMGGPPPSGGGPFAWAVDGRTEDALRAAGLTPVADDAVAADWTFRSHAEAWRTFLANPQSRMMLAHVGEGPLRETVLGAMRAFERGDETGTIRRTFRWVAARA